jgi:hypothetical protein
MKSKNKNRKWNVLSQIPYFFGKILPDFLPKKKGRHISTLNFRKGGEG